MSDDDVVEGTSIEGLIAPNRHDEEELPESVVLGPSQPAEGERFSVSERAAMLQQERERMAKVRELEAQEDELMEISQTIGSEESDESKEEKLDYNPREENLPMMVVVTSGGDRPSESYDLDERSHSVTVELIPGGYPILTFEGLWTGTEMRVAMVALKRGFRRYQVKLQKARS